MFIVIGESIIGTDAVSQPQLIYFLYLKLIYDFTTGQHTITLHYNQTQFTDIMKWGYLIILAHLFM